MQGLPGAPGPPGQNGSDGTPGVDVRDSVACAAANIAIGGGRVQVGTKWRMHENMYFDVVFSYRN